MTEHLKHLATFREPSDCSDLFREVRAKSDLIHSLAVTLPNDAATSALLELTRAALGEEVFNIPVLAVFMQIQSKVLEESCFGSFFAVSGDLIRSMSRGHAIGLHKEVADISYRLTKMACKLGAAKAVVGVLRKLADLSSFSDTCLTSIHVDFLQVCISAQMYGAAQRFLACRSFVEIDLSRSTLTAQECMRFFYYKGICHIASKDFSSALDALLTVLSLPTPSISLIAVKALKKARLVALVHTQKPLDLPKHTSSAVTNYSNEKLAAYDDLNTLFRTLDLPGLANALDKHYDMLAADQNVGLAKQVLRSLRELQVQRLAQAFLTVELQTVGQALGMTDPADVRKWLLDTVASGKIALQIDGDMVRFQDASGPAEDLDATVAAAFVQMASLGEALRNKHANLLTSPAYIVKNTSVGKSSHMLASGRPFGAGGMGMGMGGPQHKGSSGHLLSAAMDMSP